MFNEVETIRKYVQTYLKSQGEEKSVSDQDHLFQLGLVDSLFAVSLVHFIEKTWSIQVPDDCLEIENFSSINSMAILIEKIQKPIHE